MDLPPLAPRRAFGGIVAVWVAAAIAGTIIGVISLGFGLASIAPR